MSLLHENIWVLRMPEQRSDSLGRWCSKALCVGWADVPLPQTSSLLAAVSRLEERVRGGWEDNLHAQDIRAVVSLAKVNFMGKKGDIHVKATDLCVRRQQEPCLVMMNLAKQNCSFVSRENFIYINMNTKKCLNSIIQIKFEIHINYI